MAEAIVFEIAGGVISKLSSRAVRRVGLWWNSKDDLEDLKKLVSVIKPELLDAEERSVTHEGIKNWLQNLKDALYDAEDLLDDFSTEASRQDLLGGNKLTKEVRIFFSSSNQFAYGHKMGHRIKAIKAKLNSIASEMKMLNLIERDRPVETPFMAKRRQQEHSYVGREEIIGRDDDKKALLKLMLESQSEENVLIIPIVGIGGLGKTALAQFVYNDDMVTDYFELRMWVCVSDVFDVKIIVENIIKSVTNKAPENLEMDQLQKQLRDKIDGKRYLLVLDDIWNEEWDQWFRLKKLLMGGARGSRIIVTCRSLGVAKITSKCQPHVLKGLSDDDAWFLFKEIAFEQRSADSINPTFVQIGKKILEKCGGVPLVIRTIASTLSFKETENEWLSFKDNELARISQKEGEILPTLKLSYDHLPSSHLKQCFAYCRLYPKDFEIDVQTLIQLWIAQGLVKPSNSNQSLEDIGFGYFNDLVERSFLQEVREEDRWSNKCCKMHDLMHDLAESVAGIESIILDSNSSTSGIDEKCRHISIDFSLIPSHEISIHFFRAKKLRTLFRFPNRKLQNMSDTSESIISSFRCLRVLHLNYSNLFMVPRSIHKLKHLRYLDLSGNYNLKTLPKSICKIQNMQVLKLDVCRRLEVLPENIEKLVNLTHLGLRRCDQLRHIPPGIGKLTSLQTLSKFVVDKHGSHGGGLSELSGLNNLRGELKIINLGYVKNAKKKFRAANLKEKRHLQSLVLKWSGDNDDDDDKSLEDLQPHPNLKKLSVKGWRGDNDDDDDDDKSLEDLQPHPNLKKLSVKGWRGDAKFPSWLSLLTKLIDITISGPSKFKHLPTFAQFPHLERLKILELTELEYMDDNWPDERRGESELFFPLLTDLTLEGCPNMKSWWRRRNGDDNCDDQGTSTQAFPRLCSLCIEDCPLTSMPLYPSLQERLLLRNTSSRPLQQTIQINITNTTPSTSSLPLSKLKHFTLENIEDLESDLLDECLQNLTSLKSLDIGSFYWLKCLSGRFQHLTGLGLESLKNKRLQGA